MLQKRKYSHIFFDLDNTLWDFETNSKNAMKITFEHFLGICDILFDDFFAVYSKNNDFLWAEYRDSKILKRELICKRFQITFNELNIKNVGAEEMNAFYLDRMAEQKQLLPGVVELLKYLKKRDVSLYIITNGFREVQLKKMKTSGLEKYFKNVFISEDVKVPKPGREIFEYAVKSSNARKTESLMVGDDWAVDVLGANNFGIDAVYIPAKEAVAHINHELNSDTKFRIYKFNKIGDLLCIL